MRLIGLLMLLTMALTGCGSDDDAGGTGDTLTGYINVDGIEGLAYRTETLEGFTGPKGAFSYRPGETISFMIGDLMLAENIPARQFLSVLDFEPDQIAIIAASEVVNGLKTHEFLEDNQAGNRISTNKLTFLFTLDQDLDKSTGIAIDRSVYDQIATSPISATLDFDVETDVFQESGSPLDQLLESLCFPDDLNCEDEFVRPPQVSALQLPIQLQSLYFEYAKRLFLRPETITIDPADTSQYTIRIDGQDLQGTIAEMEVLTVEEIADIVDAQLAEENEEPLPQPRERLIAIDGWSAEEGTVQFRWLGLPEPSSEIVVNIRLDGDYRWIKKTFRVSTTVEG